MAGPPWRLWDLGTYQILGNDISGQSCLVYGEGAVFQDGPFVLRDGGAHPGGPALVGIEGPDADRAFHPVTDSGIQAPARAVRDGKEDWEVHIPACGDKPARVEWASALQLETSAKALRFEGPPAVLCEFSLQMAPSMVGDTATSLWVCFSRVVDCLLGPVKGGGDQRIS